MKKSNVAISPAKVIVMEDMSKRYGELSGLPTLSKAIESCDVINMELILKKSHTELNKSDASGFTPIQHAAKLGQVKALQFLLKQPGLAIDDLGKQGTSALHLAVKHRRQDCVSSLLSAGASLNVYDVNGKTAMHIASRKSCTAILQILLAHKDAVVDIGSREGATPLHAGVVGGCLPVCELLLKHGADVYKADIGNQTALIYAALESNTQVLQLILQAARKTPHLFDGYLHHKDHEGSTALHLAVVNNHIENVKLLLEAGAQVNFPKVHQRGTGYQEDYITSLHITAVFGFDAIAKLLIENGADLNAKTENEQTPLHKAAIYNSQSCAELFLAKGAGVDSLGNEGITPLHYAVERSNIEMIRFLVDKGADSNLADESGRTLMHFIESNENVKCLELLVELLAKETVTALLSSVDVDERTPLHCCAKSGKLELLNKLMELGAEASSKDEQDKTPLHLAAENGHAQCVEALFKHSKSEINDDDVDGRTPMLLACLNGHYNCVKVLLRFGGDVAARGRDESNHSALTLAACQGHLELVDLLLDNGGSIDIFTKFRETALHLACAGDHVKVVKLLLARGASVTARTVNNETPLDKAIEHRSQLSAAEIIGSDKWEDSMSCIDNTGHNPFPRLVAFMPAVAELVLDNCVTREGDAESEDYAVTYDFTYTDPHPDCSVCKKVKIWYCNDIAEHGCDNLIMHELVHYNMMHKWKSFTQYLYFIDFMYYLLVVIVLSAFVIVVPHVNSAYTDWEGCPIILEDGEAENQTIIDFFIQNGTKARYNIFTPELHSTVSIFQIIVSILFFGSIVRLIFSFAMLRLQFFKQGNTYSTLAMAFCISIAVGLLDTETLVMCMWNWRFAWIGIMISWGNLMTYIIRIPVIGIYVSMFYKVLSSVVKTMLVLMVFLVCFTACFFITQNIKPQFASPWISIITVIDMALGELDVVEGFILDNKNSLYIDNLILITMFMIVVPIALMNLLIGVAVGDIEAIKNQAEIRLITLQIKTIDEYGRNNLKYFQRKWYTKNMVVYPNRTSRNIFSRIMNSCGKIGKRSVYQRSKGWIYQSQLAPVVDTMELLSGKVEQTQARLNEMRNDLDRQNEWLLAIANKVGAKLDERGKYTD